MTKTISLLFALLVVGSPLIGCGQAGSVSGELPESTSFGGAVATSWVEEDGIHSELIDTEQGEVLASMRWSPETSSFVATLADHEEEVAQLEQVPQLDTANHLLYRVWATTQEEVPYGGCFTGDAFLASNGLYCSQTVCDGWSYWTGYWYTVDYECGPWAY